MSTPSTKPTTNRPRAGAFAVILGVVAVLLGGLVPPSPVTAEEATVRAVLFYSPSCPHCHVVITRDLPPLQARFGDKLDILLVDVSTPAGAGIYEEAIDHFNVPDDRIGVPTMVVGDAVLVGSLEIPEQFPGYVERLLASGGSDWPPIPGLGGLLPASGGADPEPTGAPPEAIASATPTGAPAASVGDLIGRDPVGNTLAIIVLIGLLGSLAWTAAAIWRVGATGIAGRPAGGIPIIALAGLVVAGYMSVVEISESAAFCGPVGDCNLVHASSYARIFGIPVGLLGVTGYAAVLGCWVLARRPDGPLTRVARGGLIAVAAAGTLFSVYLTFLEPFVIGATCAWCLLSAVLMATIMVVATTSQTRRAPSGAVRIAA